MFEDTTGGGGDWKSYIKRSKDRQIKPKKKQAIIYKALHRKLIHTQNDGTLKCSGRVGSSCTTSGTSRVLLMTRTSSDIKDGF